MRRLTKKEWLLLSRYLDGDLSAEQQHQIEQKLQKDEAFQGALKRLEHTRQVLRSVPQRKVPHSFVLTPEQAGIRPAHKMPYQIWQYSSIAAALIAVIALAAQFFSPRMTIQEAVFTADESTILKQEALLEEATPTEETPVIIQWNSGVTGGMGGGSDAGAAASEEILATPMTSTEGFYGVGGGGGAAPEDETALEESAAEELPAETEAPVTEEQPLEERQETAPNPILGLAPQEERGSLQATPIPVEVESLEKTGQRSMFRLGYTEIALIAAILSAGCALIAFLLRRKK